MSSIHQPAPTYPAHVQLDRYGRPVFRSRKNRAARFVGRTGLRGVRTGYRHRSYLWPSYAVLGMAGAAAGLGQADDGWKTALVLAALVGLALGWTQERARRAGTRWAVRAVIIGWATWALCTTWTAAASALGVLTVPLPGLLGLGGIIAQVWWAIHRYVRDSDHRVEVLVEEGAKAIEDQRWVIWHETIARDGGALPGSRLVGITELEDGLGWEAIIQLPLTDAQTSETAVNAVRRIAKAYRVPVAQVQVELPIDGLEDTARLMILTRNTLADEQVFSGPTFDLETGRFQLGMHADGTLAFWRLYTPDSGANHGMVAGTTGAGKSGLLMNLCAEIRHSGNSILLLADPDEGSSVRDWQLGAHAFAGTVPRIRRMLQGAERIMHSRRRRFGGWWTDENGVRRRGLGYFNPTRENPGIFCVIDECPDVLADPECARIIAQIGKKGRKYGVAVIVFVQIPSLSELGGDLAVRSMLSSTNIVIFRTSDKLSAQMGLPMSLPIDPTSLPEQWPDGSTTAGLGYLAKVGGRVSPLRVGHQRDPHHWASTGDPAPIPPEDHAAMADQGGNMFDDWERLLDEYDEADDASGQAEESHGAQVTGETKARIVAFLEGRGEPVKLAVIAERLGLSKPTASNALKRLASEQRVHQPERRWGMWAAGAVREPEMAGAQ